MPAPSSASLPPPLKRRSMSVSAVLGATLAAVVAGPLLVAGAVIADLFTGVRRFRKTRVVLFASAVLINETRTLIETTGLWLRDGFGLQTGTKASLARYSRCQYRYTSRLLKAGESFLGLEVKVTGLEHAAKGNAIVLARHRSLVDALLPSLLFGRHDLEVKYVLNAGLQWAPNLDISGNRLDNTFVTRAPRNRAKELQPVNEMAQRVSDTSVAAIFPEGTFFTPERRERALHRIAKRRPSELARATALRHLLPPQPAGTMALLDGAPTADAVLVAHTGFEPVATVDDIVSSIPLTSPARVHLWRIPRADIPEDPAERLDWLLTQWQTLDEWVEQQSPST